MSNLPISARSTRKAPVCGACRPSIAAQLLVRFLRAEVDGWAIGTAICCASAGALIFAPRATTLRDHGPAPAAPVIGSRRSGDEAARLSGRYRGRVRGTARGAGAGAECRRRPHEGHEHVVAVAREEVDEDGQGPRDEAHLHGLCLAVAGPEGLRGRQDQAAELALTAAG